RRAYWLRCRYTVDPKDLPPRGPEQLQPAPYKKPPELIALAARVIGGTAPASNSASVTLEELGQSDGTPGQVFALRHAPILPRRLGETILIGEQGTPIQEMDEWTEVADFSRSGPDDRHFVCDSFAGEIFFGPRIPLPDRSARQHGEIPG